MQLNTPSSGQAKWCEAQSASIWWLHINWTAKSLLKIKLTGITPRN